jgi:pimeloyl-ACP methyl ester carboxylesterase
MRRRPETRGRLAAGVAVAAAALGALAVYNAARARRGEREWPPRGRFVEVDGVRLRYTDRGEGRTIVLLHGNGAMIEDMEASGLVDALAGSYRVITLDRPGFGYSERPRSRVWTPAAQAGLILATLKAIGVERPVVVGHSWGTLVALAMALEAPGEISALALLAGYYYPTARADVPLLSGPAVPVVGDVMRYTLSPVAARAAWPALVRRIFQPAPVDPGFAGFPAELALRPSQIRAAAADTALMIPGAAALSRRYGELSLPVMIVAGVGDRIVDHRAHAVRLARELACADLLIVPGAGHMIHYTALEDVVTAIHAAAEQSDQGSSFDRTT